LTAFSDQALREVGMDAPVAQLVGIGQCRASDRFAKTHVVELGVLGRQTHFDVAQTLAVGQLGEGHDPELLRATYRANFVQGRQSMSWANSVLPVFMAASGQKPRSVPELAIAVQINTTLHRPEIRVSHGFQRFAPSFNRTVVKQTLAWMTLSSIVLSIDDTARFSRESPTAPIGHDAFDVRATITQVAATFCALANT